MLGVLVVAVACLVPAATFAGGSRPASAASVGGSVATDVTNICPGLHAVYPGDSRGSNFYGLPVAVKINGGALTIGAAAKTTGIMATVCGYFVLPTITARTSSTNVNSPGSPNDCPACSISFAPAEVDVYDTVEVPATIAIAGPISTSVAAEPAANGGLNINFTAPVTASISVPEAGVTCMLGPVSASLTTQTSGTLTGAPITGSLTGATATGVGNAFTVPAATPSTDCPADLLPSLNTLAGLPAPPGVATFTAPFTLATSLT